MDHHYIPQFYLKQWADPDGRIPNYRWPNGRVIPGYIKSTKGTALSRISTLASMWPPVDFLMVIIQLSSLSRSSETHPGGIAMSKLPKFVSSSSASVSAAPRSMPSPQVQSARTEMTRAPNARLD